jgi:outer membrane protein assembly factor BamB
MNQKIHFLRQIAFIFIFTSILFYIGANTDFSTSHMMIAPSSVLDLATVPGSSDPNQDEWPMFRGQLNHTGEAHTTLTSRATPFWSFPIEGSSGVSLSSSPTVVGGRMYIAVEISGSETCLWCINATTGQYFWMTYGEGWEFASCPAVADGRLFGGSDGNIYCLNAITHGYVWSRYTGISYSSPAVVGGRVYVGSDDNRVYCLNATTGTKLWNYTTAGDVSSSPAVSGGRVYVGSKDYSVYCLNATTGTKLWNYTTGNYVQSSPAVAGGRVYIGSDDHNVYCLDATTGGRLWNYTTGGIVLSSPAVAGGRVYVGSGDHKVYCLDATTGGRLWNYTTGSPVYFSPAVADGRVYAGSDDGYLYCLPMNFDSTPPTYVAVTESANPLDLGGIEAITITGVADLSGIETVKITFEGSNHTMTNLGNGTWEYNGWVPSAVGNYGYSIYIQDNAENWNMTNGTIQVISTKPTFSLVLESADPLVLGDTETIWIVGVADLSGIQTVKIAFEGSNYTMTDLGGGNWRYNAWTPSSANNLGYKIYIQDNVGNWNTVGGSITVIKPEEPSQIPAFTLPLMILGLAIVGGLFILRRRTPF